MIPDEDIVHVPNPYHPERAICKSQAGKLMRHEPITKDGERIGYVSPLVARMDDSTCDSCLAMVAKMLGSSHSALCNCPRCVAARRDADASHRHGFTSMSYEDLLKFQDRQFPGVGEMIRDFHARGLSAHDAVMAWHRDPAMRFGPLVAMARDMEDACR